MSKRKLHAPEFKAKGSAPLVFAVAMTRRIDLDAQRFEKRIYCAHCETHSPL